MRHSSEAEQVVLVDGRDRRVGVAEKLAAHERGLLHRAVSVFVFNDRGELLLQQRSPSKYHSGGLWSNTCCGHPRPREGVEHAATRRLQEEMGFACRLHRAGTLEYSLDVGNGLHEHEYLHLFVGHWDGEPVPAPDEVSAWQRYAPSTIDDLIEQQPERFTAWFPLAWRHVRHALRVAGVSPSGHATPADEYRRSSFKPPTRARARRVDVSGAARE